MTKFSDEEFLLIENLINEIAKEDKNSKKQLNFSNEEKRLSTIWRLRSLERTLLKRNTTNNSLVSRNQNLAFH